MNAHELDATLPIGWSIDAADGPIQGPLALAFLRGRRLALHLRAGQSALLLGDGRVQAIFGPGDHELGIGDGAGGIDPARHLLFLSTGDGLVQRWTVEAPLRLGGDGAPHLIGACRLDIIDARAFHDTFLAGVTAPEPAFVLVLVDRLVQGLVAAHVADVAPAAPDAVRWAPAALQTRLTALKPSDLADSLAPCGLECRELAVYTVQPPVDLETQARAATTPREAMPMSGHSEDLRRH